MTAKSLKYFLLICIGVIITPKSFSQVEPRSKLVVQETVPLFSRLHTLSIHVRDTITQDSVFRFLADRLNLPVYYYPVRYGARKYSGVYAGNLVLEPCGPYSDFLYASNDFRAIFFGLTFEPFKSISLSSKGLTDRKIPHEAGDSYIYFKDPDLVGDNITISLMDKGQGKIEDKRTMDSLLLQMTREAENGPGIEYVKEIRIGYRDNTNLQKWIKLIGPDKLINNKAWSESNKMRFQFVKTRIREVQGITFKVKSLEKAMQYLQKVNLIGEYKDRIIILDKTQAYGLQILFSEND